MPLGITFTADSFLQYQNSQHLEKINELIKSIQRDGFNKGIGKPEPLKGNFKGWWSRRINGEHRLIYRIQNTNIEIVSLVGHYQ